MDLRQECIEDELSRLFRTHLKLNIMSEEQFRSRLDEDYEENINEDARGLGYRCDDYFPESY